MKFLEPMRLKPEYFEGIERDIKNLFDKVIFEKLAKLLKEYRVSFELQNDNDPITEAIRIGKVYYDDGYFRGTFNATISKQFKKLGAKYSIMRGAWQFIDAVPSPIQIAIANSNARVDKLVNELIQTLDSIDVKDMTDNVNFPARYLKTTEQMYADFERTTRSIAIKPKFTKEQQQAIADNYAQNLDKYIQDWSETSILDLRQKVTSRVYTGGRAEGLAKQIQAMYNVSRDKAKFLARQETSLLMSQMREQRYKGIGSNRYKWSGAMDAREREDHKLLNGQIFSWDDPPITNRKTGARNNPGEDYGCRCVAIPIVEGYNDDA